MRRWRRRALLPLLAALLMGCVAAPVLPPLDLEEPGWTQWTGQLSWQRGDGRDPLAGELFVARRADGERLVTVSKAALPLLSARAGAGGWRVDTVDVDRAYGGRGRPPGRVVWFALPGVLADGAASGNGDAAGWTVRWPAADEVLLTRQGSDERIRVVLDAS